MPAAPAAATPNPAPKGALTVKNKLTDLNNHLFAQLERLSEEGMDAERIEQEVKRADAIVDVSEQIIRNADLQLKAVRILAYHGDRFKPLLGMIDAKGEPSAEARPSLTAVQS